MRKVIDRKMRDEMACARVCKSARANQLSVISPGRNTSGHSGRGTFGRSKEFLRHPKLQEHINSIFFLLLCVCACVGDSAKDETMKNESSSSTTLVTCGLLIHSIDQC